MRSLSSPGSKYVRLILILQHLLAPADAGLTLFSPARTLVNLVGVFDVSPLHDLTDNGRHPYCEQAIKLNGLQCGCALRDGELGEITRARMRWLQTRYSAFELF